MKIGRNDFCPCGSGLKYKKCCLKYEKKSTTLENINNIVRENQGADVVKNVFYKMYEIQGREKWEGACHATSALMYIALKEAGIPVHLCLGQVEGPAKCGWMSFDHSWIEVDNKVIDIAINSGLNGIVNSEPILYGKQIYSLKESEFIYGIPIKNLKQVALKITEMSITQYMNGGNRLWNILEEICNYAGVNFDIEMMKKRYNDEYWKIINYS